MSWGGQFENLTRAAQKMLLVIPLTLVIIVIVLGIFFRSFVDVLVSLACIPLALVGGVWALVLRGFNFNVSAGVGFVSLFGIATMSGVLFVARVKHMRERHPELSLEDLVTRSASEQLRPWLMTVALAVLGMTPAALGSGIGSEVQRTLGIVVVGGLSIGIILTIIIIPALYYQVANLKVSNDE
jgi:cobalt-zinc-cadmium resistance protein CzcA